MAAHKHERLIKEWSKDNSIEFEFDYGTGIDFTTHDCDIKFVIDNPNVMIRVKPRKPRKEKRWIAVNPKTGDTSNLSENEGDIKKAYKVGTWQIKEIEVEV